MFAEQLRTAIAAAPLARLPELAGAIWKAFAGDVVSEAEAEALTLAIEARKASAKPVQTSASGSVRLSRAVIPARKVQRPPVRSVAIERRRRLAASGPLPPALAARFTTGELAVLRIVGDEVRDRGRCILPLDAIAARAGVSRSLAKAAIRQARALGMLEVQERRRAGAKSLTNVVTIADREWLAWMKRGAVIGGRKFAPTDIHSHSEGREAATRSQNRTKSPIGSGRRRLSSWRSVSAESGPRSSEA